MFYSPGSIRKINEKTNKWQARFTYYEERDGKKHKRQLARNFTASSQREAKRIQAQIHMELEQEAEERLDGGSHAAIDPVLSDYARNYIDSREASGAIERTTAANYRASMKLVLRHLRDTKINAIRAGMVQKMDEKLLADGLAPDTVSKAHRFLKQLLDQAESEGLLPRNPITRAVRPPKRQHREPSSLSQEERRRLFSILDGMEDTPLTLAIRLGISDGLRNEEAIGLRWENVDFEHGIIKIREAITVADGQVVHKEPKTAAGIRELPLENSLSDRLRSRYVEMCLEVGKRNASKLYVLGNFEGNFYHPSVLVKEFSAFAKMYGITDVKGKRATFYTLRHTFATMLLQNHVDAKTVSSLMGHSGVAETLNTYASTDPAAKAAAASVLSDLIQER